MTIKWIFTTGGDVSATPILAGGAVYSQIGEETNRGKNNVGHLALSHNISECNIDERKQIIAELD